MTRDSDRETWLPCPDFEHWYEVSSLGRVRSRARGAWHILALGTDSNHYPTVAMNKAGKRHTKTVHRLVCRAFHGEPKAPCREAAHLDGVRSNCRASNLKWVGRMQNFEHQKQHGTFFRGSMHPRATITEADALAIKLSNEGSKVLAERYNLSPHTIADIRRGKRWAHVNPTGPRREAGSVRKHAGAAIAQTIPGE